MVAAAAVVRGALDDDDGGGDGGTADGDLVILCATDLADACRALDDEAEVLTADPATTATELAESTLSEEVDAWVTSTAWLEVADARAPEALGDRRAVAMSSTLVATAPGRFEAIAELCEGQDVWACLGDAAGDDWGDLGAGSPTWRELKVGLTDPDTAAGLPVLASAAAGFFGGTDFAANDPRFAEFEGWLANIARPSAGGDADPARTLATRPGTYSAAGAVGAVAERFEGRDVESIDPAVAVPVVVAIVELRGGDGLPDTEGVGEALAEAGWSPASDDDLAPTLKPGVMAALHTLWRAVTS
jgi:hypothetical protein